jgi:hypothetical protein
LTGPDSISGAGKIPTDSERPPNFFNPRIFLLFPGKALPVEEKIQLPVDQNAHLSLLK